MVLLKCASVSLFVYRVMRDPSGFIPSPMDRYRQILLPTLRLFQVILTSTTMNHQQGAAQESTQMIILQKCKCCGSLLYKHCTCILMFLFCMSTGSSVADSPCRHHSVPVTLSGAQYGSSAGALFAYWHHQ